MLLQPDAPSPLPAEAASTREETAPSGVSPTSIPWAEVRATDPYYGVVDYACSPRSRRGRGAVRRVRLVAVCMSTLAGCDSAGLANSPAPTPANVVGIVAATATGVHVA